MTEQLPCASALRAACTPAAPRSLACQRGGDGVGCYLCDAGKVARLERLLRHDPGAAHAEHTPEQKVSRLGSRQVGKLASHAEGRGQSTHGSARYEPMLARVTPPVGMKRSAPSG